jgi:hypothetical protein
MVKIVKVDLVEEEKEIRNKDFYVSSSKKKKQTMSNMPVSAK